MDTVDSKLVVSAVQDSTSTAVASPTVKSSPDVTSQTPDKSSLSDAVSVSLQTVASSPEDAKAQKSNAKSTGAAMTRESAQQFASDFEKMLNRETVVRFQVSLVGDEKEGTQGMRFQVVDRQTGKIIRQFPPEDALGLKENADLMTRGVGALLDNAA